MRTRAGMLLLAVLALAATVPAWAQENSDLDRIPNAIPPEDQGAPGAALTARRGRYYVEDAAAISLLRHPLVPFPPPRPADWQNRTSLDGIDQWDLDDRLTLTMSDRLSLYEASSIDWGARRSLRNDFREGYLTWQPAGSDYLEGGRVNVRNGVALGFNPTDFFKSRTAVDQASLDPSALRQNRLGTLMARAEHLWSDGSASLALAPKLYPPTPIAASKAGFDPRLDRTNGANRLLATASYDLAGLAPQALLYREGDMTKLGLNLSHQVGQSVIAYGEWAGGRQQSLIAEALAYGKRTGTLPPGAPIVPPTDTAKAFRNDLALGASWTSTAKITTNLEYHYHQAGFSDGDWRGWFASGQRRGSPGVASQLWYIRGYANDRQQPLTRQQAFLRVNATDAFTPGLELTALAFVDLYDGSSLVQLQASYYLSNAWTIGAYVSGDLGGVRSERGSLPQAASAVVLLVRYF